MAFGDEGAIFYGITPSPARRFLATLFQGATGGYDRLVVPCAGRLTVPLVAAHSDWKPTIEASDVSLYSAALGAAAQGRTLARQRVQMGEDLGLDLKRPAHVLYALKLAVMERGAKHYRNSLFCRDLRERRDDHLDALHHQLEAIRKSLKPLRFSYEPLDMWEHIARVKDDPRTVLVVNAPIYSGSQKMFDTGGRITWREPAYVEFDPKRDLARLFEVLMGCKALALWYRYGPLTEEEGPQVAFAFETRERTDHLCGNRRDDINKLVSLRSLPHQPSAFRPGPWPVLSEEQEITEDSRVEIVDVPAAVGLYYRDLFAHRLGTTKADAYCVALLDDHVFAAFGLGFFKFKGVGATSRGWVHTLFTVALTSRRYRLARLQIAMALSSTMRDRLIARGGLFALSPPKGMRTAVLSYFRESKPYRGLMRRVDRREHPDAPGLNMITYEAEWTDGDLQEVFRRWLEAERQRQPKRRSGPKS